MERQGQTSSFPEILEFRPILKATNAPHTEILGNDRGSSRVSRLMKIPCTLALAAALTTFSAPAEPTITDTEGQHLTISEPDGKPVVRYEYAHELGEDGKVTFDTAKVFHHVLGPDGAPITKGPGGKFPHHRGIFIGWNKLKHGGHTHDLWHVKNTTQKHRTFKTQEANDKAATVTSLIDWIGNDGMAVVGETRTVTTHFTDDGAYALIDFTSVLTGANGAVELNGDPEHAGIQFRPSQKVAENKSAKYTFHKEGVTAQKDRGLPWVAETFEIDGQHWTVQHMSHPDNPENSRWSAYRDYGRFGEFPVIKIAEGESVTLKYRFRVTKGKAPKRSVLSAAYESYSK